MRRLSPTVRITLWFAVMMLIIDALVLTFIMVINGNVVTGSPESVLVKELNANVDRVRFENQRFRFDKIRYHSRGVYTILYDEQEQVAPNHDVPEVDVHTFYMFIVYCYR